MAFYDRAVVRLLPAVPRAVVKRLSERYIAGEELTDASRVVAELNAAEKLATVDVLGEELASAEEAEAITREYLDVLAEIERAGLDSNISVKPTGIGLKLDVGLCRANLERLVRAAASRGNFVRIDMEDSTTTDETLALYRELREAGFDNVGVVLQSSLKRSLSDARALADLRANVRICKGIYIEDESIQFRDFDAVRANFVRLLEELLELGCYVGIATHDEWLISEGRRLASGRPHEFQMLLGVRTHLGDELVREGRKLRIYVPYGRHWYGYSLRRLQENPKIAGYVAADTVSRLLPGRRVA
ncbi:MAG: proline dehydrogenase family protein [Actinomycetota bacterium]|nr:proline dehydrogenase family protein [Actinomycetota bacterium]